MPIVQYPQLRWLSWLHVFNLLVEKRVDKHGDEALDLMAARRRTLWQERLNRDNNGTLTWKINLGFGETNDPTVCRGGLLI